MAAEKDFNYNEGVTTVKEFVRAMAVELSTATAHAWALVYPENVTAITDTCILKVVKGEESTAKDFYLRIHRPEDSINHALLQIGTAYDETAHTLVEGKCSAPARYAWYRETTELYLGEWLPISYWMNFGDDYLNLVVQGDPSPDTEPYDNYLISWAHVGAVASYEGADEDIDYNWGLTVGSDIFYETDEKFPKEYGNRTGTGVTDFVMVGTRTGTPYQAHYLSFHTTNPWMDKNFITSSAYTHKYHLSEGVIVHAYDRERGKMKGVLFGDRSAIFHNDELIKDKGLPTEESYKWFATNAPYWLLNNSPNVLYGLALRKS